MGFQTTMRWDITPTTMVIYIYTYMYTSSIYLYYTYIYIYPLTTPQVENHSLRALVCLGGSSVVKKIHSAEEEATEFPRELRW